MFRKSWKVQLFYGYAEWRCEFTIRGKSVSAKFRELSGILTRKDVSLKLKGEGISDMCEECNGIWKRYLDHE